MQELQQTSKMFLDSREVAEMVEKRHCDLLRDIENYIQYLQKPIERNFALNEFFVKSTYKDKIGRTLTCYQITRKGCELIAHKMTGQKGVQFTANYINRFHELENLQSDLSQKPKQLEEYNYHAKYYNGIPVVTISDISHFTHLNHSSILYHIKNNIIFRKGRDYYYVDKCELAKFKLENVGVSSMANSLYLVTKSGYDKLAKIYKQLKNLIEFKTTEVSNIDNVETAQEKRFDLRVHEDAMELFDDMRRKLLAIEQVHDVIMNYCLGRDVCHDNATALKCLSMDLYNMSIQFSNLECLN